MIADTRSFAHPSRRLSDGRVLPSLVSFLDEVAGFSLAVLGLFVFAPLMGFIALAVRLDSPGPVFSKQKVRDYRQREIEVLVFRTFRRAESAVECEKQTQRRNSGITRVGGFLRNSSLEKLPQLLTIARSGLPLSGYIAWLSAISLKAETKIGIDVAPGAGFWSKPPRGVAAGSAVVWVVDAR